MRFSTRSPLRSLTVAAVLAGAGLALTTVGPAHADEEFDLAVTPGHLALTTKPGWHVNQEYPWKLLAGDKKVEKSEFKLTPSSAKVAAPKGEVKLKGAVCFGESQCKPFVKVVSVP